MSKAPRILVVVDPTSDRQPALERAAVVATALDLELQLLVCIHAGVPERGVTQTEARDMRSGLLRRQLGHLQELARGYPGLGIRAKAVWDRPLHEAIIRETLRCDPRMVMKDTHHHAAIGRALFTPTDWHLIQDCPAPLWLVRDAPWPAQPVIAAFVDPMHAHDQPAELDHRLLAEATLLAQRLGGTAHAVHCCHVSDALAGLPMAAGQVARMVTELEQAHGSRLAELAAEHHLAPAQVHLRSGTPAEAIPAVARELGVGLAVLGAVARSRLERAFLGSTAERVLDRLPGDVLVIKPPRFESPVTYRAQAPDFMEVT